MREGENEIIKGERKVQGRVIRKNDNDGKRGLRVKAGYATAIEELSFLERASIAILLRPIPFVLICANKTCLHQELSLFANVSF